MTDLSDSGPFKKPCAIEGIDKPFRPSLWRNATVGTMLNPRSVLPEEAYAIVHAPPSDTMDGRRARAILALLAEGVPPGLLLEARLQHFMPESFALDMRPAEVPPKTNPDAMLYPLSPDAVRFLQAHLDGIRQAGQITLSMFSPLFPGMRDGLPIAESTLKRICDKWLNAPVFNGLYAGVHTKRLHQYYATVALEKPLKDTAVLCAREVLYMKLRKRADELPSFAAHGDIGRHLFRHVWEGDEIEIRYTFTNLDEARNLWFLAGGWYEFMPKPQTLIWYPSEAWKAQFMPWYWQRLKRDDGATGPVSGDPFPEE